MLLKVANAIKAWALSNRVNASIAGIVLFNIGALGVAGIIVYAFMMPGTLIKIAAVVLSILIGIGVMVILDELRERTRYP